MIQEGEEMGSLGGRKQDLAIIKLLAWKTAVMASSLKAGSLPFSFPSISSHCSWLASRGSM